MRPSRSACFILVSLALTTPVQAQTTASPWTGEWGHYEQVHTYAYRTFYGQGISVGNCTAQGCAISIATNNREAHGDADGTLHLQSPTQAIAHLTAQGTEHCTLQLTREASAIRVASGTGDCTYFLTPGGSFLGTYTFRSHDVLAVEDIPTCFAADAPVQRALCTDKALAAEESQWELLFLTVADLNENNGLSDSLRLQAAQDGFLQQCNNAPDPAACLHNALAHSAGSLHARQNAWIESVTAPGDPAKAAQAASAIAGHYRHSFRNGDVQGDSFLSTDRLTIQLVPEHAIHYDVRLNFYNGHECSLEGTATYKRIGFFVDQKKSDVPNFPLCVFEIISGKNGVRIEDPTGGCKMMSCGMRGGYHGAEFTFKDRQARAPVSTHPNR